MTEDARNKAKSLYLQGYKPPEISDNLRVPLGTVYSWKKRDLWNDVAPIHKVDMAIEDRLALLVSKPEKTKFDYAEIENLGALAERTARIKRYNEGEGNQTDLNPKLKNRNKGQKKKPTKNFLTDEQIAKLREVFFEQLFAYQLNWWNSRSHRTRDILKSRQIGATWYFAREALIDALETGNNKIFMSASKNQAFVFKRYIQAFVLETVGVEITGSEVIVLGNNGAELRFLGTNARTAQGYHGDIYIDEQFWIANFAEFDKVASGMAMHKKWRKTYFSSPSIKSHQAYAKWIGAKYNKGKDEADKIVVDVNDFTIHDGKLYADAIWRNVVTVEDAERLGCNLFDIKELRLEYSDDEFRNLLMCEFIDDTESVFSWNEINACMVDTLDAWEDFHPYLKRPFGNNKVQVILGYDPAHSLNGDKACLVAYALPTVEGGKGRVLEGWSWRGMDVDQQCNNIAEIAERYDVVQINLDATGAGVGVSDILSAKFPGKVRKIIYTPENKARMITIAKQQFRNKLIEFDAGWKELASSLMTIKAASSKTGKHITFQSARSVEGSHADEGWALMNALHKDVITSVNDQTSTSTTSLMKVY